MTFDRRVPDRANIDACVQTRECLDEASDQHKGADSPEDVFIFPAREDPL